MDQDMTRSAAFPLLAAFALLPSCAWHDQARAGFSKDEEVEVTEEAVVLDEPLEIETPKVKPPVQTVTVAKPKPSSGLSFSTPDVTQSLPTEDDVKPSFRQVAPAQRETIITVPPSTE